MPRNSSTCDSSSESDNIEKMAFKKGIEEKLSNLSTENQKLEKENTEMWIEILFLNMEKRALKRRQNLFGIVAICVCYLTSLTSFAIGKTF